ncbi:MAG: phosphorylated adapter RNA export RNA-binding domain-containing protein [Chloroflexota bacterium]
MADVSAEVTRIAARLNETTEKPLGQIQRIIEHCGIEFADFMVDNSLAIEEAGGMMTANGQRRRTLGGVFFFLVRHAVPLDLREVIFPPPIWLTRVEKPPSPYPPFDWEHRVEQLQSALEQEKGTIEEVNIQLKGRPGYVEKRDGVFILTMEQSIPDNQTFPRGVPQPPNDTTRYFVFAGEEQYDKNVSDKLKENEKTQLYIDGVCYYDESLGGVAVYARSVKLMKKKKKKKKAAETPPPEAQAEKPAEEPAPPPAPEAPLEPDEFASFPPEIAKKLRPLYGARKLFQKRLADIEAMPEDKQSGLKAAKMMLERTEKQIADLEAKAKS